MLHFFLKKNIEMTDELINQAGFQFDGASAFLLDIILRILIQHYMYLSKHFMSWNK